MSKDSNQFLPYILLTGFADLVEYRKAMSRHMQTRLATIEEAGDQLDPDSRETYFDYHVFDELIQLQNGFPTLLMSTCLVALHSFLEEHLTVLCGHAQRRRDLDLSLNLMAGSNTLDRAKLYLKRACKLSFPDQSPEWQSIQHVRKLRNALVHDGMLGTGIRMRDDLQAAVQALPGVAWDGNMLTITEELLEHYEAVVEAFLDRVADTVFEDSV